MLHNITFSLYGERWIKEEGPAVVLFLLFIDFDIIHRKRFAIYKYATNPNLEYLIYIFNNKAPILW